MPLMLCGHFFLKLSHAPEYQDATFPSSLQVGALGGLLMAIPMMIIEWIIKRLQSCSFSLPKSPSNNADNSSIAESQGTAATAKETPIAKGRELPLSIGWLVVQVLLSIASVVGLGAGTGYFGSSVLIATGHDVLGVLAATRAGAVGTAILGPGAIVAVFLLALCCGGTAALTLLIARAGGGDNEVSDSQLEMGKVPETGAPDAVVNP
jgi:hypothetical protein